MTTVATIFRVRSVVLTACRSSCFIRSARLSNMETSYKAVINSRQTRWLYYSPNRGVWEAPFGPLLAGASLASQGRGTLHNFTRERVAIAPLAVVILLDDTRY